MSRFLQQTMKSPGRFLFVLAVFSLSPLSTWFAVPLIMLVTMVNGLGYGLLAEAVSVGVGYASQYWIGNIAPNASISIGALLLHTMPAVLFGYLFNRTKSIAMSLQLAFAVLLGLVALGSLFNKIPAQDAVYDFYVCTIECNTTVQLTGEEKSFIRALSNFAAQFWLAAMFVINALFLFLTKRWQGRLFPQSENQSALKMRLDWRVTLLSTLLISGLLLDNAPIALIICAWMAVSLLIIHGVVLCHWFIRERGLSYVWLIVFYSLIFMVPQFMLFMVIISISDAFTDLRTRLQPS